LIGDVLFIGCEDDPDDTVVPRLTACGADLARIHFLEDVVRIDDDGERYRAQFSLDDATTLREAIDALPALGLVVIDPVTAYFGQADANKNAEVRAALAPLMTIALQTGVAILAVNHLTKKSEGPAVYRSLGSIGVAAAARSVLAVVHDPNSDQRAGAREIERRWCTVRLALCIGGSRAGQDADPRVAWCSHR
jgi:RecA-family ATPase